MRAPIAPKHRSQFGEAGPKEIRVGFPGSGAEGSHQFMVTTELLPALATGEQRDSEGWRSEQGDSACCIRRLRGLDP